MCKALALIPGVREEPDRAEIVEGKSPEEIIERVFGVGAELRMRVPVGHGRSTVRIIEGKYAWNGYGTPNLLASRELGTKPGMRQLGGPVVVFSPDAPHSAPEDWLALAQ